MKQIGMFRELFGDAFPKLGQMVTAVPIEGKDKVLNYLKSGSVIAVAPGIPKDVLTGQKIPGDMTLQSDGEFEWRSEIAYYFDKYNLKLPDEFIEIAIK